MPVPEDAPVFRPEQHLHFLGEKATLPVSYATTEGKYGPWSQWRLKGFGENRPLYHAHLLANHDTPVLVVEGEKAANAAAEAYPECTVISWSGGAGAVSKSNWSVLAGRDVTIWPDNDKAGREAAQEVQTHLSRLPDTDCRIVPISRLYPLPEKWDLADPLPSSLSPFMVTSLLFDTMGLHGPSHQDRTVREYLQCRKSALMEEGAKTAISTLGAYLIQKDAMEALLRIEAGLVRERLEAGRGVDAADMALITMEAQEGVAKTQPAWDEIDSLADIQSQLSATLLRCTPTLDATLCAQMVACAITHVTAQHRQSVKQEGMHGDPEQDQDAGLRHIAQCSYVMAKRLLGASTDSAVIAKAEDAGTITDPATILAVKSAFDQQMHAEMRALVQHQSRQQQWQQSRQIEMER